MSNAAAVLTRQIRAERDRVRKTVEALERPHVTGFDVQVASRYDTVRSRFLKVLLSLDADLSGLLPLRGPAGRTWAKLTRTRAAIDVMTQETLALLQAWMGRQDPLHAEMCDIADALLVELTAATGIERAQLAIPAGDESFTPRTMLVRVRFPMVAAWDLPVVAHEFGHLIVQEHRGLLGQWATLPLQDLFEGKDDERPRRELFSDLFAVYTTGPAFACTCLLARFDPFKESKETGDATHPDDAKRAYFILAALDRLRRRDGGLTKAFGDMHERLSKLWASLDELGRRQAPDDAAAKYLRGRLHVFLEKLDAEVPGARYTAQRWTRAKRISDDFSSDKKPADVLAEDDGVVDVLNGAWRWRVQNWAAYEADSRRHDDRSMELLRAVVG